MLLLLVLSGCASTAHRTSDSESSIGPYPAFSGRLIVIEPTKRWQVLLTWQAKTPDQGALRIVHAATNTIVELRWQGTNMDIRDNQQPAWRPVGRAQLSEHGIVIPPQELAAILLGRMPAHFRKRSANTWDSTAGGTLIRLKWKQQAHSLSMTDIKHGRKATLIIQP